MERAFLHLASRTAAAVYRLSGDWCDWHPLLSRVSAHVAVVAVALLGVTLSSSDWPDQQLAALSGSSAGAVSSRDQEQIVETAPQSATAHRAAPSSPPPTPATDVETIYRRPNPHTMMPKRPRLTLITYRVEPGDTVQSIAAAFDLEPTTVMWANPEVEDAPDLLRIGQEILILPIDGVYHQVEEGDTIASIAGAYEAEEAAIVTCTFNDLGASGAEIREGAGLIVPGGKKPYEPKKVTAYAGPVPQGARGTGRFQWPVVGTITQNYWYGHRAIDVGAPTGSAVTAADGGYISFAGWTDVGYGYLIVVDHGNDFVTYYAHLSRIYVALGQTVTRGQVVGALGNTGNSTGPHLHFEVRRGNLQQNPYAYLP